MKFLKNRTTGGRGRQFRLLQRTKTKAADDRSHYRDESKFMLPACKYIFNVVGKSPELQDEVFDLLERKKKETLAHKRSFFVRMVSDPKIYNPSIAKSLPSTRRHLTETADSPMSPDGNITIQPPSSSSWISWPLAFLFQGIAEDGSASDLPIR
uniref:Uncharacterized protein LOC114340379 n=1 Tax=Diabrotica virgifera virgifera TaxID=50390 RepID=A0A6P7GC23_DIAVI